MGHGSNTNNTTQAWLAGFVFSFSLFVPPTRAVGDDGAALRRTNE
jgi:hypothetical protein